MLSDDALLVLGRLIEEGHIRPATLKGLQVCEGLERRGWAQRGLKLVWGQGWSLYFELTDCGKLGCGVLFPSVCA